MLARSAVSVEMGNGDPCRNKNTGVIDVLETSEAPENGLVINRDSSPKNMLGLTIQLETNLATAMKENKNCFYKYIINKRRAKEKFPYIIGCRGKQ